MELFNRGELTTLEVDQLQRAEKLMSLMNMDGWQEIVSILLDISQRHYPNPKDKSYQYNPWKQLEKDYTFARGGTEVVSEFISLMEQQKDIADRLHKKQEAYAKAKKEGVDDLYEGLQGAV